MAHIKFGSQVYTWFMQEKGKVIRQQARSHDQGRRRVRLHQHRADGLDAVARTTGLATSRIAARLKDALAEHKMELAGLALVCGWNDERETAEERAAADYAIATLKQFPGAKLGTVPLPSNRKNLHQRRMNLAKNVNAGQSPRGRSGDRLQFPPEQPAAKRCPHPG